MSPDALILVLRFEGNRMLVAGARWGDQAAGLFGILLQWRPDTLEETFARLDAAAAVYPRDPHLDKLAGAAFLGEQEPAVFAFSCGVRVKPTRIGSGGTSKN